MISEAIQRQRMVTELIYVFTDCCHINQYDDLSIYLCHEYELLNPNTITQPAVMRGFFVTSSVLNTAPNEPIWTGSQLNKHMLRADPS